MLFSLAAPDTNERGPLYMEQALRAIHQPLHGRRSMTFYFARRAEAVGLYLRVPNDLSQAVAGQLFAQYPEVELKRAADDALDPPMGSTVSYADLRLRPDVFPIRRYPQFEDPLTRTFADPLTAILTTLAAAPKQRVQARIDISVCAARPRTCRRMQHCLTVLAQPFFRAHPRFAALYASFATSRWLPCRTFAMLFAVLARRGGTEPHPESPSARSHDREDALQAAQDKLGKHLFEVSIRLVISGPPGSDHAARAKLHEMAAAFGQFGTPHQAEFRMSRFRRTKNDLPRLRASDRFVLSAEELATIYHPPTQGVRAATLASVLYRELEPPAVLSTVATDPDLAILGTTAFRNRRERFGIQADDRRRHVLITGKTGMGKSTLLLNLIAADLRAGRGVALIDPHGDLADAVLATIPAARTNDVVLFDAGDTSYPLGFNPLAHRTPQERPLVASAVLSAFKKLYGDSWGPRLEHIFRNCLLALLEIPGTTLLSVLRILSDARYRQTVVSRLADPVVKVFWTVEFPGLPPKLQAEAIAPIQNKVGHFVSSPVLRNIVGQARSSLDIRQIMDQGQVLIVNLSKGRIGDDASALLGSLLVTSIQLAAMSRAAVPEAERRDLYLFVDEFQNFATSSFASILSEARKYRLNLTLANQYLAQMEEETADAVFGNVGTLLTFQVGARDAELLAEQLGSGATPQDLMNLPKYTAYARLLIDGMPSRPFSMRTLARLDPPHGQNRQEVIRRTSRHRYARRALQVAAEIETSLALAG